MTPYWHAPRDQWFLALTCDSLGKIGPPAIEPLAAAMRGDIARVADLSFDCIMCGMCVSRCPAEEAQPNIAILARRLHGRYLARRYWRTLLTVSFPRLRPAAHPDAVRRAAELDEVRVFAEIAWLKDLCIGADQRIIAPAPQRPPLGDPHVQPVWPYAADADVGDAVDSLQATDDHVLGEPVQTVAVPRGGEVEAEHRSVGGLEPPDLDPFEIEAAGFGGFIRALQAIVAGRRDRTLAAAPDLHPTMAAEILFLIETLEKSR